MPSRKKFTLCPSINHQEEKVRKTPATRFGHKPVPNLYCANPFLRWMFPSQTRICWGVGERDRKRRAGQCVHLKDYPLPPSTHRSLARFLVKDSSRASLSASSWVRVDSGRVSFCPLQTLKSLCCAGVLITLWGALPEHRGLKFQKCDKAPARQPREASSCRVTADEVAS